MAVLTISRAYQNGGMKLDMAVAQQSGYDFIDKGKIFTDLKSLGEKWGHGFEELDEVTPQSLGKIRLAIQRLYCSDRIHYFRVCPARPGNHFGTGERISFYRIFPMS